MVKFDVGDLPEGLLEKFYQVNQKSELLSWKPIMVNVEYLPQEYAGKLSEDPQGYDCLVPLEEGSVGISQKGQAYRPYYSISKVAFTDDNEFALVKLGYHCAPMSGAGEWLICLRKVGLEWKLVWSLNFWIS
jgi:hypothetical protein